MSINQKGDCCAFLLYYFSSVLLCISHEMYSVSGCEISKWKKTTHFRNPVTPCILVNQGTATRTLKILCICFSALSNLPFSPVQDAAVVVISGNLNFK